MNYEADGHTVQAPQTEVETLVRIWSQGAKWRWLMAGHVLALCLSGCAGCREAGQESIAVIPRTSGTMLWEPENVGAQRAAAELGEHIYWNASTREDDIDGQIALVDRIRSGHYRGLVLAPDHSQALITPVRRALESGLPVVIVGSPTPIPAGENLTYVLNDEQEGGRLAALRTVASMHGRGEVALIGIDTDIAGIVERARSFEHYLARYGPSLHIGVRRMGTLNFGHEQAGAEEMLRAHPEVSVIVALTSPSTRGAISANLRIRANPGVKVIGFDPESLLFDNPNLDSIIVENTLGMGARAVELIHARRQGRPFPAPVRFKPTLVTRENVDDPALAEMLKSRWQPDAANLQRSVKPE